MTKQELNLLQLAASGPAKPGAASAEIVRRELAHADFGSELLDDVPDELFGHALAPNSASTTHAAKEAARRNSSGFRPLVKETLYPIRYRDGSNVTSLPTIPTALTKSFQVLAATALFCTHWQPTGTDSMST